MDELVIKSVKITGVFLAVISAVVFFMRKFSFVAGFFTGTLWAAINFFLTIELFKIALLKTGKKKVFPLILVKFPVLYLLGFFLLAAKLFSAWSFLAGMSLFLLITGVTKLWFHRSI